MDLLASADFLASGHFREGYNKENREPGGGASEGSEGEGRREKGENK